MPRACIRRLFRCGRLPRPGGGDRRPHHPRGSRRLQEPRPFPPAGLHRLGAERQHGPAGGARDRRCRSGSRRHRRAALSRAAVGRARARAAGGEGPLPGHRLHDASELAQFLRLVAGHRASGRGGVRCVHLHQFAELRGACGRHQGPVRHQSDGVRLSARRRPAADGLRPGVFRNRARGAPDCGAGRPRGAARRRPRPRRTADDRSGGNPEGRATAVRRLQGLGHRAHGGTDDRRPLRRLLRL